jgi:hypothetical protein
MAETRTADSKNRQDAKSAKIGFRHRMPRLETGNSHAGGTGSGSLLLHAEYQEETMQIRNSVPALHG